MHTKINWGIIGLGNIANSFASDLQLSKNATLYGVASRNIEKARNFSNTFNSVTYYGSYEQLAKTPEIDIIYIYIVLKCIFLIIVQYYSKMYY